MARHPDTQRDGSQRRQQEHFDRLAEANGEIWWGSTTAAGIKRMQRRVVADKENP